MEKLANSATAALLERDELQKQLKINAEKQKRAKAAQLLHRVPAEGLQFANHAELRAYFSGRHLEDLAKTNGKIKHSERPATGRLSVKLHMPSQIEKDIGKERMHYKTF